MLSRMRILLLSLTFVCVPGWAQTLPTEQRVADMINSCTPDECFRAAKMFDDESSPPAARISSQFFARACESNHAASTRMKLGMGWMSPRRANFGLTCRLQSVGASLRKIDREFNIVVA